MRLTADLIQRSPNYINAVKDRELDLRGNKIPTIENLGVTKDLNDTIDFTDNDIRHLTNFPLLRRLRCLLLSNNRISRLDSSVAQFLPNLEALILTNNTIQELGDLEPLGAFKKLQYVSLLDNPVTRKKHYRHFVIWKCPNLRVLDFQRVRDAERKEARKLFQAKEGITSLAQSIIDTKTKTFEPGAGLEEMKSSVPKLVANPEEQEKIREAIKNAKSLDEVARLENLLRTGRLPGDGPAAQGNADMEVEEDE
ncbi:uncharacterized protein VTP21DRAFT_7366 [Calcarisporiella thermophila]|uniref:uncharacterized protein n=1 Tax=Calcarisporiella thermophila TaxID=911321 RepID=UPI003743B323